jgi:nucleotide-binding universal stress UspA family protein
MMVLACVEQSRYTTRACEYAEGYRVTELLEPGHVDHVILATLHDTDADLLVMGAYGHTRIRELISGRMTTTLLRASAVPVLVIH